MELLKRRRPLASGWHRHKIVNGQPLPRPALRVIITPSVSSSRLDPKSAFRSHSRYYLRKGVLRIVPIIGTPSTTPPPPPPSLSAPAHVLEYRALCIIVDDMVDTGGTLDNAVRLLKGAGAGKIIAFATHGRFSGGGEARVAEIPGLERLIICNTLPHRLFCFAAYLVCFGGGCGRPFSLFSNVARF